jgi:hypothetical protein
MEKHGVIYSGDHVVDSYVNEGRLFITSEDHFRIVSTLKDRIQELTEPQEDVRLIGFSGHAGVNSGKDFGRKLRVPSCQVRGHDQENAFGHVARGWHE